MKQGNTRKIKGTDCICCKINYQIGTYTYFLALQILFENAEIGARDTLK